MTDKLMPTEGDRLPSGLPGFEDSTGIPSLTVGQGASGLSSHSESKVSGQVVLAGLVLILAAGAIYGMRFVGLNAGFGGEQVKIDYTSQAGTPESARRFGRVMTELDGSLHAVQLASGEELPPAPFTRPSTETPTDTFVFEEPSSEDELKRMARMAEEQQRLQREQRAELLRSEIGRLNVQAVMARGRMPVARVNGQMVTIGKYLGSFEVVDITGQSVLVAADGLTWELQSGMPARLLD